MFSDTQIEQYKEVYKRYYRKLVEALPLTDALFRAALVSKKMFYGDLLCQVDAKETSADKNEHFLIKTIDHSLNIGIISPLRTLLQVMESFGSATLKSLAESINADILKSINESSQVVDPLIYSRG